MSSMSAVAMHVNHTPTAKSLVKVLDGVAGAASDMYISDLTLDSRAVTPGSMFIAIQGLKDHGLNHAAEAIANGARVILFEPAANTVVPKSNEAVSVIAVPQLGKLLGGIADRFFDSPSASLRIAGVTGTNGKTTSAYLLPAALARLGLPSAYAGTLGYGHIDALQTSAHTTPDCITVHRQLASMRDAGDLCVGMEISSHALDQDRINGVRLHSALFTNLTRDHLDYHGTLEAYGAAKESLFYRAGLQYCAINAGDAFGRQMIARLLQHSARAPLTAYATDDANRRLGDRQLF